MNNIHIKRIVKNNRNYEYYYVNYKLPNNKYKVITAPTKEELMDKLDRIEGKNVNYNLRLDAPTTLKDMFNEYLELYIKNIRSIRTYISYKADLKNHILPFFENLTYKDINSSKIQEHYNYLIDKGLSSTSANRVYLLVKESFEYGVSKGIFYKNPCNKSIKKKAKDHRLASPIRPDYLNKIWDLLDKSKYKNLYKLMLYTSLRRGEALGIKINDIDLDNKTIYIHQQVVSYYLDGKKVVEIEPHTKTHLSRLLTISDETCDFIGEEIKKQHVIKLKNPEFNNVNNLLFTDELGSLLDPNKISMIWKSMAKESGNPKIRLHDLRHTGATIMYEATGNIYAVQKSLGHADPRTTEIYVGPSAKLQREGASAVAQALNKQLGIEK